jgi:hypothetical protein
MINPDIKRDIFCFSLAVSQILDSLEDTQWLTIGDRVELIFLQKLFEDKQLRTLLEVKIYIRNLFLLFFHLFISYMIVLIRMKFVHIFLLIQMLCKLFPILLHSQNKIPINKNQQIFVTFLTFYLNHIYR